MQEEIKNKIRYFIELHVNTKDFEDHNDIFKLGFVNSLFAMQLVSFVEKKFNFSVEREELKIDNFKSVSDITNYVNFKLNEAFLSKNINE